MPRNTQRLLLLAAAASVGCALHFQSIRLPVSRQSEAMLSRVVIEDVRRPEDKDTFIMGEGRCGRAYGEDFIEPSKVEYLRSFIAERLAPTKKLVIRLERFDTVERCDLGSRQSRRAPQSGGIARPLNAEGASASRAIWRANSSPPRWISSALRSFSCVPKDHW
jgi:hypothetical protein